LRKVITIFAATALAFTLSACATESSTGDQTNTGSDTLSSMTRATGETLPATEGFPLVTLDENGAPSITPVDGDAPGDFGVATLIKGSGEVVGDTDIVTVHYAGYLWDGTPFDSSWAGGQPLQFSLEQVVPGFTKAIAGQTIGSQVVAILPPADGYGESGSGSIPPNATLIFVVDILAATPAQ
jgi:peptidylprolyl isomerase